MERVPQTLVIDASAAAKWFLEEEDSDKALIIRDAHIDGRIRLTAPDLIVYEVANALNYNSMISDAQLIARVQDFSEYDLDLVPPSAEYAGHIVRTARELSISVYDAYSATSKYTTDVQDEDIKTGINKRLELRKKRLDLSYADAIGYAVSLRLKMKFLTGNNAFQSLPNVEFVK